MASYDIQFQKGLSLREFNAAYATEEQCREAICKARWGAGFRCPRRPHAKPYGHPFSTHVPPSAAPFVLSGA